MLQNSRFGLEDSCEMRILKDMIFANKSSFFPREKKYELTLLCMQCLKDKQTYDESRYYCLLKKEIFAMKRRNLFTYLS